MKHKLLFAIMLIVLTAALTGAVCAEDLYTFTLTEAGSVSEDTDFWYLDLKAPAVSGMADEEKQAELNEYFIGYMNYIEEIYEEDKAYFLENYEGDEMPRFGYESSWDVLYENDDYFVFRVWVFYAAGSSMTINEYYTLDRHTGLLAEISDFADVDRLTDIRGMILDEMNRKNEEEPVYWVDDETYEMAFSFIEEYHHWYVNEAGNLVITFDKYEIAPGAFGESSFEIIGDKAVLMEDDTVSFDLYVGDSFEEKTDNWSIRLTVPEIHGLSDPAAEEAMNAHFTEYAAGIKSDYDELVTHAAESVAEGNDPHFYYEYGYEILVDSEDYFVFKTEKIFVGASLSGVTEYWNLSKTTGELLKYGDFIPEESRQAVYDQIYAEMKEVNESGSGMYYIDDEADTLGLLLSLVEETHHWYLNGEGGLVIVFDKYEIGPGVMGPSEFVIDL